MHAPVNARPVVFGLLAFGLLLTLYFAVLSLVSGWTFTVGQFADYWFYIVPLGAGFGLQVAGLVTFATQYQVELFWVGLAFNAAGIAYIGRKFWQASREHTQCAHMLDCCTPGAAHMGSRGGRRACGRSGKRSSPPAAAAAAAARDCLTCVAGAPCISARLAGSAHASSRHG